MKKILLFILAAGLAGYSLNAQKCACNPEGWQPITVSLNNVIKTVKCGYQFSLKCNEKITLRGEYKCLGDCAVKYTAVLKKADGTVVANYPSFTWAWTYSFAAAGNYSLEITPVCGDKKCTPCRFFFTVTCAVCDCNVEGWQRFKSQIGTRPPVTVSCGYQFALKKGEKFFLDGKYLCKGDCNAKYAARLTNNVTGALVQDYPNFTFPWNYAFTIPGNYKLEIIPVCGDKRCTPCVFYFTVI